MPDDDAAVTSRRQRRYGHLHQYAADAAGLLKGAHLSLSDPHDHP
jgi:hypothetical protein